VKEYLDLGRGHDHDGEEQELPDDCRVSLGARARVERRACGVVAALAAGVTRPLRRRPRAWYL
jgi:hypothetical protein